MTPPTVYVALSEFCAHDERPRKVLAGACFDVRENALGRRLRRAELLDALRGADAVLAGLESYDAGLLETLPRLRCISRCGVGTDVIDLEAAARLGVTVLTTPDEVVDPVAELTVGMLLALARNLGGHGAELRSGVWHRSAGNLLSEWTIGLVGFGRIGRAVARHLRSFAPRILAADPNLSPRDVPDGVGLRDLPSLLAESDVVSLHASRPASDGPLIGRSELAMMRPGAMLVNTARGYLVEEAPLVDALSCGRLAGAALDVFGEEPYSGPLATMPNVICTPHVGSTTRASRVDMETRCAENVVAFFVGRS